MTSQQPQPPAPRPPGPRNVLLATLAYLRDPYGSLLESQRRYGELFSWPSFLGPMVVTTDPTGVEAVMTADPDTFSALGAELLGPVIGESNLILLSGPRHRAMRRLQTPPFQGSRMRAYGETILAVADEQAGRWPADRAFDVHKTTREISLEVILRAVMGLDEPGRRAIFKQALLDLIASLKPSFMFVRALRRPLAGLSAWARFKRREARVSALFDDELRVRKEDGKPRQDILSLLLEARYDDGSTLTGEELKQQIMNLIGAGHETTASALAFALHHIHRQADVESRLVEELAALPPGPLDPETVAHLPYLEAVCSETLRIDPVAPVIGRTLQRGLRLQGHDLPPGMSVGVGIVNLHRRADLFAEPDRFLPDRFLGRKYSPFEYLPFGGGARRCLGAAFALYEMKLVLATILRNRRLRLVSEAPVRAVLRNTTVGPAGGVAMHLA